MKENPSHRPFWVRFLLAGILLSAMGMACSDKIEKRRGAEAQVALCLEHFDEKDYPSALKACLDGKDRDSSYAEVYNGMGLIYLAQRRYPEAVENFEKGLDLDANLSNARTNLGIALAALGRTDEAIEQFKLALQNDLYRSPDIALVNLCEAYFRKKDIPKAIDHCKQAIERNRSSCFAHFKLADAYREMRQQRTAEEEYGLAIKYCSNWITPYLERGTLRIQLKEHSGACADLRHVAEADPESEEARQARRYLESLGEKCPAIPAGPAAPDKKKSPVERAQPLPYLR